LCPKRYSTVAIAVEKVLTSALPIAPEKSHPKFSKRLGIDIVAENKKWECRNYVTWDSHIGTAVASWRCLAEIGLSG